MAPNQNDGIVRTSNGEGEARRLNNGSTDVDRTVPDRPYSDPYKVKPGEKPYKLEIVWKNVFAFMYLHYAALNAFTYPITVKYFIGGYIMILCSTYGISAGAHRLWAHKSYKANRKMQAMLLLFQTLAGQNSCIEWTRDHRVHHKYSDTNADPHNVNRGFFFAHMGWLMCKKHPDVRKYGSKVDMSDMESDPMLRFQQKYYLLLILLIRFVLPIFIGVYILGESFACCWHWNIFSYVIVLHATWSTNSVSHIWGDKPFEKDIKPTDTLIIGIIAFGEGWHNFHHVYPWDYKVSELPRYWCNFTIPFIDFFAWLGWATDLKTVSDGIIRKRIARTGDGSHRYSKNKEINNNNNQSEDEPPVIWGWDDKDMDVEERSDAHILNRG